VVSFLPVPPPKIQSPVTSSPLSPKYLPQHPLSKLLSLYSSLNGRHQVPHPHKTTGKIAVLHALILTLLNSEWEDRMFWTELKPDVTFHIILIFIIRGC
jgi:hypothetical protein